MYYADSKKTIEMNDTMIDVFFHYVAILFKLCRYELNFGVVP